MKIRFNAYLLTLALLAFAAACSKSSSGETMIKSTTSGDLAIALLNSSGQLKSGDNELFISFTDSSGNPVDVGSASLNFRMPAMGSMAEMNDRAQLVTTETPGKYRGRVNLQMGGTWEAQVAYQGAKGTGQATMTVSVK